ncbi:MAG: gliding motility protein GldC [Bacteroidota bacterium]|nr:gliding motility protein GldC [Bacteroidota bacterium]MDP4214140.1 gliding motility protein GldC [Bacteroidota bacterium]MDP4249912.1 gliding motility protein GldC [Bacteroidota bacterium]
MKQSTIQIQVSLDDHKIPEEINWNASDSSADNTRKAKAFLLSLWDGQEKNALRIDLWTKDMMVDEMEDFFYQTLITMADTYQRATGYKDLSEEIKSFASNLYNKSRARQMKENKL